MRTRLAHPLAGVALAAVLTGSGPAFAVEGVPQPASPYLSSYATTPWQPNVVTPTLLVLSGATPSLCSVLSTVEVVDASHIVLGFTTGACADSLRPWSRTLDLGLLPEGTHQVDVRLTVEDDPLAGGATTTHEASLSFVVGPEPPPPPLEVPGDYPSVLLRGVTTWSWTPVPANAGEPTILTLRGWFPYLCGRVVDASATPGGHVALTLEPGAACSDTVRTWEQTFDLGLLPAGHRPIEITMTVIGDHATASPDVRVGTFHLEVVDSGWTPPPPAPPPPPVDSLSFTAPNPFSEETRFAVTMAGESDGEVAIYDVRGRRVALLFQGRLAAGTRSFTWDGRLADGTRARDGIYFYRLNVAGRTQARRALLLSAH